MDLEEVLGKVAELSREELRIVRKRVEEKTPARDHAQDFHEMQDLASRLDEYATHLRKLHDDTFQDGWRDKK